MVSNRNYSQLNTIAIAALETAERLELNARNSYLTKFNNQLTPTKSKIM